MTKASIGVRSSPLFANVFSTLDRTVTAGAARISMSTATGGGRSMAHELIVSVWLTADHYSVAADPKQHGFRAFFARLY